MSTSVELDELMTTVADEQRAAFRSQYWRLTKLPRANLDLQAFLDAYLRNVVELYAATAGAIWFRAPDATLLSARASLGMDRIGLGTDLAMSHEQLLQFALTKHKSLLVKPYSAPERQAKVSNPSDSFVVLGPVEHHGEQVAVVELFLGPTPTRGRTAGERNRYVLWLDHLLSFLCRGIEYRLLRRSAPLPPALEQLTLAGQAATRLQDSIRDTLGQYLATFTGWNFGTLEDNQAFTTRVHLLLDQFGLRVCCPQCGAPAILRCQGTGNSKTGVFLYDHTLNSGRTFHGGPSTFPSLTLVPRAARRKAADNG